MHVLTSIIVLLEIDQDMTLSITEGEVPIDF